MVPHHPHKSQSSAPQAQQLPFHLLVPTKYDPRTGVDREVMDELKTLAAQGYRIASPIAYRPGPHKRAALAGKPIAALYPVSEAAREIEAAVHTLLSTLASGETS